jgi:hypothetical protein
MTVLFPGKDSDEKILPDYGHVPEYGRCISSVTQCAYTKTDKSDSLKK